MKLCFINPSWGHRTMIYGLANHLPKNKYQVTILHPTSSFNNLELFGKPDGNVEIVYFPSFILPKIDYTLPHFPKMLSTLFKFKDYDIIQVGDYFYPTSIPPLIFNRHRTKPMILTVNALPGYNWEFGSPFVDFMAKGFTYSVGKQILCRYDKVVALYNNLSDDLRNLGIPTQKIAVIPNGIDVERFQKVDEAEKNELRKQFSISDNEKVLLFIGRLSLVKRVDFVIRLAHRLIQDGQPVRTIIVGDGLYRKRYERLAQPSGKRIIFVGWVSKKLIPIFYAIADVVVLTSLNEGLPNVLLEAAAAGKSVVATNVNGVSEIVLHGKTGFLVDRFDADSLCKFTQMIFSDPDLQEELGHNAIGHVKKKFSWQTIVNKYDCLYDELLN